MLKFNTALTNLTTLLATFKEAMEKNLISFDMETFAKNLQAHEDEDGNWVDTLDLDTPAEIFTSLYDKNGNRLITPCNTACCIVGYAAISEVPEFEPIEGEEWNNYSDRLFINEGCDYRDDIFDFLFGGEQASIKEAAIYRLEKAIAKMKSLSNDGDEDAWDDFGAWCDVKNDDIARDLFYPEDIQELVEQWEFR